MSTTIGDFAGTALDGVMPADDKSKANLNVPPPKKEAPAKTENPPPVTEKKVDPPAESKTETQPAPKEGEFENPNLVAEKPAAPKTDTTVVGDDEIPKGMTGKAAETWKIIKTQNKTLAKERDDFKVKLDEQEAKIAELEKATPDVDALKKELQIAKDMVASFEGEISVTRVESSKRWKETVSAPQRDITDAMTELAKRYEIDPDNLMRAIREPDSKKRGEALEELLSDFKHIDQIEVAQAAKDWQRTQKIAETMRTDAGKQLEELTRAEKAEMEQWAAGTAKDYVEAVATRWDQATAKYPWIRKGGPEHAAWNAHHDDLRRAAEAIDVNELPVEDVAEMKVASLILPDLHRSLEHLQKQLGTEKEARVEAEKKLADYKKTAPGAGAGGRTAADGKTSNGNGGWKFADVTVGQR